MPVKYWMCTIVPTECCDSLPWISYTSRVCVFIYILLSHSISRALRICSVSLVHDSFHCATHSFCVVQKVATAVVVVVFQEIHAYNSDAPPPAQQTYIEMKKNFPMLQQSWASTHTLRHTNLVFTFHFFSVFSSELLSPCFH